MVTPAAVMSFAKSALGLGMVLKVRPVFFHGDGLGAKRCQLVNALLDRGVEALPAAGELANNLIGEHHHQDMPPGAGFRAHIDGADFEMPGLGHAKGLFDQGEILVAVVNDLW